ncbi:DUF4136 domain-containing protein [Sphingomonas daechungensis]|uniref:DUF4136 domain-containing protein n=2 Tax=Sphingomonas daechungensis TaxID=1176646 RepID=A0ABX6T3C9_9SPHN|nr:DUF4136 domain-containing protein [Sphingomonas daechungensis]
MMRKLAVLAAALALTSCATGPTIRSDFDPSVNFTKLHTYTWVFTTPPAGMNPLLFERVQASIDRSLAARGFTKAEPGDFAVAFTLGRRDRVEVTNWGGYGGFYGGWGWGRHSWGWAPVYSRVDARTVTDGTLAIDMFDTGTKHPIWHGTATQQINPRNLPDQAAIDRAIDEIIAKFPPQQ